MTSYSLLVVECDDIIENLRPYTNYHTLDNSLSSLLLTAVVWTGSIVDTSNFIQK